MKCLLIYILIFSFFLVRAQNLVPNSSFENYTDCPTAATFYKVAPWCGLGGGEEAYNKCFSDLYGAGGFGVPYHQYEGFQYARTGNGFAGVITLITGPGGSDKREYLHVPLTSPLQNSKIYCGTMYVNLFNECKYATDRIGMSVTSNSYACNQAMPSPQSIAPLNVIPQVYNPVGNFVTDTLNWIEVSGTFTATGTEAYLTIGNFYDDLSTNYIVFNASAARIVILFFVDDVSVEEVFPAKAKNDTLIMQGDSVVIGDNTSEAASYNWQPSVGLSCTNCPNPKASPGANITYTVTKTQCKAVTSDVVTVNVSPTGINELNYNNLIKIGPNPVSEYLNIDIAVMPELTGKLKIKITDVLGREILATDYQSQLNFSALEKGIYFVTVQQGNALFVTKKIIKE